MDRVGARHQRRVERRRDLADDLEADEDRQHEDRERVEEFLAHAGPPAGRRGRLEQLLDGVGHDRAAVGDDGRLGDLVLEVEVERAVLDHAEEQRRDVARVERGRAGRHRGRQVVGAMIVTPFGVSTVSPAFDSSTLPPSADAAMSTITEPGFICSTASRGHEHRRLAAGHLGGGDDHVHAADDLVELGLLGGPLLGRQLAGVAAGAGRVDRRLELHELGAERLGLLARLGADVVGLDDRAEAAGRADRLEPGDADAQDQHVGGLGRAGRGGQQREVARRRRSPR